MDKPGECLQRIGAYPLAGYRELIREVHSAVLAVELGAKLALSHHDSFQDAP